jgi:hypothetical protein
MATVYDSTILHYHVHILLLVFKASISKLFLGLVIISDLFSYYSVESTF